MEGQGTEAERASRQRSAGSGEQRGEGGSGQQRGGRQWSAAQGGGRGGGSGGTGPSAGAGRPATLPARPARAAWTRTARHTCGQTGPLSAAAAGWWVCVVCVVCVGVCGCVWGVWGWGMGGRGGGADHRFAMSSSASRSWPAPTIPISAIRWARSSSSASSSRPSSICLSRSRNWSPIAEGRNCKKQLQVTAGEWGSGGVGAPYRSGPHLGEDRVPLLVGQPAPNQPRLRGRTAVSGQPCCTGSQSTHGRGAGRSRQQGRLDARLELSPVELLL